MRIVFAEFMGYFYTSVQSSIVSLLRLVGTALSSFYRDFNATNHGFKVPTVSETSGGNRDASSSTAFSC